MSFHTRVLFGAALTVILAAGPAFATCAAGTEVSGSAMQSAPGIWTYGFSVLNGCAFNNQPFMTDFYVPYFEDANIADLVVPGPDMSTGSDVTWTATILPTDDLFDLDGAGVIDFEVTVTPEIEAGPDVYAPGVGYYFASGFGFTSTFAPIDGPYAILEYLPPDYTSTETLFGDPPVIPGSPDAIAALSAAAAPEPGTTALVVAGLCVTLAIFRRRGIA